MQVPRTSPFTAIGLGLSFDILEMGTGNDYILPIKLRAGKKHSYNAAYIRLGELNIL
jgi:hypothetical protein